jgi:hypothetical protein
LQIQRKFEFSAQICGFSVVFGTAESQPETGSTEFSRKFSVGIQPSTEWDLMDCAAIAQAAPSPLRDRQDRTITVCGSGSSGTDLIQNV